MITKFKGQTLQGYLRALSGREPVPGGGSAAALAGALGVALLEKVARYSVGRGHPPQTDRKIKTIIARSATIKRRLLDCVDRDAQAYMKVVLAKKSNARQKRTALRAARAVPREVCRLCYSAVQLTPFLVRKGSPYLLSDVEVAVELLQAAYQSAQLNIAVNQ